MSQSTRAGSGSFAGELRVRIAEASTQVAAAELLGEELQASIAASDLADLQALAARNDVDLDGVGLHSGSEQPDPADDVGRRPSG